MKLKILMTILGLGIFVVAAPALAEDIKAEEKKPIKVGNKICPLSHEDVDSMGGAVEYEYKGKIYNFCCEGCLKDFEKNPEEYIKFINKELKTGEDKGSHKGHDYK